jgi:hypothetical protein
LRFVPSSPFYIVCTSPADTFMFLFLILLLSPLAPTHTLAIPGMARLQVYR